MPRWSDYLPETDTFFRHQAINHQLHPHAHCVALSRSYAPMELRALPIIPRYSSFSVATVERLATDSSMDATNKDTLPAAHRPRERPVGR